MDNDSLSELQNLTKSLTIEENRIKFEKSKIVSLLEKLKDDKLLNEVQLEALRVLRNGVAGVVANAQIVIDNILSEEFQVTAQRIISTPEENLLCLRVFLQLVANSVNQEIEISQEQLNRFQAFSSSIFNVSTDEKAINFLSFALLGLMQKNQDNLLSFHDFIPFWSKYDKCDFCILCLKHLIQNSCLSEIENNRCELYSTVKELELHDSLSDECVGTIVKDFTYITDFVFKIQQSNIKDLKVAETLTLLDIIISISKTEQNKMLQDVKSLLINMLYLLRMAHSAGKEGILEQFKPITKLSELAEIQKKKHSENNTSKEENEELENNPVHGFKVKLIQLLVNLVWEHKENQDLVGQHSGFQVLLDCSQVDARNPFITQWVVMSMKALCQNNPDNQAILASLRREGVANSDLWAELGIKLDENGETIKVAQNNTK